MRKKWLIIGIILLLLLVFLRGRKRPKFSFETKKVERGNIEVTISASGTIKSETEVKVQFQTSGKLAWLGVKEGDKVKKGQALASLDKQDLKKRFEKEMNDYLNERWDFEQTQDDYKATKEKALVTDSIKRILEKAQFDLNNVVLDLEISDLAVKYATIYSPINGIVTKIEPPLAGVNVVYTTAYIELVDPNLMEFEAIIDETEVAKLTEGQKATITLDAFPKEEFPAEIKRISFKATQTTSGGTGFTVYVSLPENLINKLKSGFNGDMKVITNKNENVLLVPNEAVLEDEAGTYVFKLSKNKAKKSKVEIGIANDELTEIISGLSENDFIISKNASLVKDGQKLN